MKKLFYISTNPVWGGSEILWYKSSQRFKSEGYDVVIATKYNNTQTNEFKSFVCDFDLNKRFESLKKSITFRILNKVLKRRIKQVDNLLLFLREFKPDLIILSQGNNVDSLDIQRLIVDNNFKYCNLTQLVTEFHWLNINNLNIQDFQNVYQKAKRNFFTSKANMSLHHLMLAYSSTNSDLVYNPGLEVWPQLKYPDELKNYQIAFVGRIECFHKGIDLLIKIFSLKKWRDRNIDLNFYGGGPHIDWLRDTIRDLKLSNVFLNGYSDDVTNIWRNNQLLILPSRMEGQSLALIEAQMCGRAAIVTNVGGASEIIVDDQSGFISRFANEEMLDLAMERAWNKRDEWKTYGELARENLKLIQADDPVWFFNKKVEEVLAD